MSADENVINENTDSNQKYIPKATNPKKREISPVLICSILTIWMVIGIIWGFSAHNVLILTLFLLPVVGYEIYRTKGVSTIFASWALLAVLILEIILIVFHINYDLGKYLDLSYTYIAGQYVPLGDIKILGPTLLAVFSLILIFRTAGPYTKWLSIIIIISAFVMVQIMNPEIFKVLLRSGIERIFWLF